MKSLVKTFQITIIFLLALKFLNNSIAGEGGGLGPRITGSQLKFIQIDDILLNTLVAPAKTKSALTIGNTWYRELPPAQSDNYLEDGLGFLIDLSKVQSVDTDHGIINLDDLISPKGAKLLIDRNSGIHDLFTKDGELIIFNR